MGYVDYVCPRCGHKFRENYCPNCQHTNTLRVKEYNNGWFLECTRCDKGWQWCSCPKCGASVNVYKNQAYCFLTNACCTYLGKADDCEELTILRKFRDEYMLSDKKMANDVKLYYVIAPKIIEKIDFSGKENEIYADIYNNLVCKCLDLIKDKRLDDAYTHYKNYVYFLCKEYGIDYEQVSTDSGIPE